MSVSKVIKKYLSFCLRSPFHYLSFSVTLLLAAGLSKSLPIFYGKIIETLNNGDFEAAKNAAFVTIAVLGLGALFNIIKEFMAGFVLLNNDSSAKQEYIKSLQMMDYEYHTNKSSGSLISLAKRGTSALDVAFMEINDRALVIIFEFILAITVISQIHPYIALTLFITIIIAMISGAIIIRFNVQTRKHANEMDDKITALTVDNLVGFETVKIFANEKWEQQRLKQEYKPWYKAYYQYLLTFRLLDSSNSIITLSGLFVILLIIISLLQQNQISLSNVITVIGFVFGVNTSINSIIYKFRDLAKTFTDLTEYFRIIDLKPKIQDSKNPITLNKEELKGEVEFSNISFEYHTKTPVLHDISLSVKSKETIALVGKSGSGKTTFTKLLMRFYDPTSGSIKIDDINIKDITQENSRKLIGLVPQETVLFNESIKYNIAYAKPGASMQEIRNAAKLAHLDSFINSLPQKYETVVGERGIKLSGGQKQRLGIARVMLENPPIIIFDEATSQLDSATEKKVQEAFKNLTQNKTTLIIAHRLSTINHADRIVVFSHGKIAEIGTHQELINHNGIYNQLWSIQSKN